jgi:hypothetical protein
MASSYTGLGTELMTTGENAGTWGTKTNTNLQIIEQMVGGYIEKSIAGSAQTTTLSVSDGSTGAEFAHRILKFTGTITGNQVVTIPLDVQQMFILVNGTSGAYTVQFKYVSGSGSSLTFATTDKGTKIVYATADDSTDPNLVDTGISTNTITGATGDITIDSPADIILDADGADISLKDGGTLFGTLTNSSGELVLKSSSSGTTAATFSGANVTLAGTVGSGAITSTSTVQGTTITATTAFVPDASDGAALGTSALEFSDLFLADGAVVNFGDDQEVTLTHVADAGLLLNSDNYLTFRDSALKIHSSADGQLDIDADTEVEIAATTVDLNGILDVSGVIVAGGQISAADGTAGAPSISNTGDLNTGLYFSAADKLAFSSGGTAQVTFQDGAIVPVTDDDIDLGTSGLQFKDVYVDGTLEADAITIGGSAVVSSPITAVNNATANEIVTIGATTTELEAEGNFTYDGNNAALTSSTSTNPIVSLTNTNTDANGAILKFIKDAGEAGAANDVAGLISFYCDDAGQAQTEFARIQANVIDATAGGEEGSLDFHVAEYDGTLTKGMSITGLSSDTNITVDISTHDGSAGGLKLGGTLVTSTAAEINLIDGGTSRGTTAVASGDGILINDNGTMAMTNVDTVSTYFASHSVGGGNIVTTGALDSGSITSGFGAIDNGTSNIRSATITAETAFVPDASGGADLGTTALEFNDAFFNDSAVINFGDDQDTTLTHTDGTGLTLNSTNKLTFGDAATYVNQSSDGVMTIAGEATIDLTASTAVLVSNDLKLDSDSSVIGFGADNDTTLTHTDGTGLTLNSTNKLCFNDASQFVYGVSNAILGLGATDEIDLTATAIDINGTCDVSGTLTNGSAAVKVAGTETIWIPANAMTPTDSDGCADIAAVETTSGRPDMYVLDFDKDSDEAAQFTVAFPKSWNAGTVTFQVFWSGLAATGGVSWGLQGVAFADNDSIDTAYGTAIVVDDTEQGAVEEMLVSAESGAVTIAGSPGDNEFCYFRIFRDVSDANDDSGGDARLHGIKLFYTTDAKNDA